jgi:hypothetical protein
VYYTRILPGSWYHHKILITDKVHWNFAAAILPVNSNFSSGPLITLPVLKFYMQNINLCKKAIVLCSDAV